jgi:hypothetical protein
MIPFKSPGNRRLALRALLLICGGLLGAETWADDALELARAIHARPGGRDVTSISRMMLTEKGRAPRTRELMSYRLDRGRGETATLIRFLEPPDIAGTGLLSIDRSDGSNEQSLYLPELDRVRRISGDRKGGRFVGSDLYFEDLQQRQPAKDQHRLLGNETVDGVVCEVLESTPRDPPTRCTASGSAGSTRRPCSYTGWTTSNGTTRPPPSAGFSWPKSACRVTGP